MASLKEVAEQLRLLEGENGRLDPVVVVDAARDPASPLHAYFEWDDTEAARQHRLGQARQLIRRIKIEVTVRDVPVEVVRYVRDHDDGADGYRDILRVRDDADIARATIIDEMARVSKAARRAKAVAAVLGIGEDVERIIALAGEVSNQATVGETPPLGTA